MFCKDLNLCITFLGVLLLYITIPHPYPIKEHSVSSHILSPCPKILKSVLFCSGMKWSIFPSVHYFLAYFLAFYGKYFLFLDHLCVFIWMLTSMHARTCKHCCDTWVMILPHILIISFYTTKWLLPSHAAPNFCTCAHFAILFHGHGGCVESY